MIESSGLLSGFYLWLSWFSYTAFFFSFSFFYVSFFLLLQRMTEDLQYVLGNGVH